MAVEAREIGGTSRAASNGDTGAGAAGSALARGVIDNGFMDAHLVHAPDRLARCGGTVGSDAASNALAEGIAQRIRRAGSAQFSWAIAGATLPAFATYLASLRLAVFLLAFADEGVVMIRRALAMLVSGAPSSQCRAGACDKPDNDAEQTGERGAA